jgi:hypothetical protein
MRSKLKIQIGGRFGRWKVLSETPERISGNVAFLCICECGRTKNVQGRNLIKGLSKSCGCLTKETTINRQTTHGKSKTSIYRIWQAMKNRCLNKVFSDYKNYGGRGIKICKRWQDSFEAFYKDMGATYEVGLELERKRVDGHYYKKNCVWATRKAQQRNKRTNHKP